MKEKDHVCVKNGEKITLLSQNLESEKSEKAIMKDDYMETIKNLKAEIKKKDQKIADLHVQTNF